MIHSFSDFLIDAASLYSNPAHRFVFRGQSDGEWGLTTSFHRYCKNTNLQFSSANFFGLLDQFIDRASDFLSDDLRRLDLWEQIALAQHYSVPTPFLDWSRSPYIAAFFALCDFEERRRRGTYKIFAIDLNDVEECARERGDGPIDRENMFTLQYPVRVITTKLFQSKRLTRQMGLFTLFTGANPDDLATFYQKALVVYEIDKRDSDKDIRTLALMGITASTLMDSLDGVAVDVMNSTSFSTAR